MTTRKRNVLQRTLEELLSSAVDKSNTRNTEALLSQGANPNSVYDKEPVIFYAQTLPILRLLVEKGAKIDTQTSDGMTRLNDYCNYHLPSNTKQEEIRFLLEKGADPNLADKNGMAPLHTLCSNSRDPVILRLLVQHRADVNQQDNDGNTPLHHLAGNRVMVAIPIQPYQECIRLLVEAGADPLLRNEEGQTPSEYAQSNNQTAEFVRILKEAERNAGGNVRMNNHRQMIRTMGGRTSRKGHKGHKGRKARKSRKSHKGRKSHKARR